PAHRRPFSLSLHDALPILTVLDPNGCSDTSAAIVVEQHDFGGPLTITDQTVCIGAPVVLTDTGPGDLSWFADSALTVWLGSGPLDRKSTRLNSSHVKISYA